MIKKEFNQVIGEFEEILQKIASDVASGLIFEKLAPSELLNATEPYTKVLKDLAIRSEELMRILKPEKTHTISVSCKNFTQTLTTFNDILHQKSPDPLANSHLAFEQLRKALTDGSDLLFLMRDIRDNPSPLMDTLITLRRASETKGSIINIQAAEEVKPVIKYVLSRIDEFRAVLMGLEKKVGEMKQIMRELQEESLEILSGKTSTEPETEKVQDEKQQLSLSNFKAERNRTNP